MSRRLPSGARQSLGAEAAGLSPRRLREDILNFAAEILFGPRDAFSLRRSAAFHLRAGVSERFRRMIPSIAGVRRFPAKFRDGEIKRSQLVLGRIQIHESPFLLALA